MRKIAFLWMFMLSVVLFAETKGSNFNVESGINVVWSIKEGAALTSFSGVTVTFSGKDSAGRNLDGKEVENAVAQGSSTNVLFYEVLTDGSLKPVDNGTLHASNVGLSITYVPTEDKGYKNFIDGAYVKPGNYCIVIDEGDVLFTPNRDGLEKVYNDQKYVLNFSIINDCYTEEFVDFNYVVSPKNGSVLNEIREFIITFSDCESIIVNDTLINGMNWLSCEYSVETEEQGAMWITKSPMYWSLVEGKSNALRIYVASDLFGAEAITDLGAYRITIPEGIVCFSKTETSVVYNNSFVLNYEVSDVVSSVEVIAVPNVYVYDGMIVSEEECQIFTITGQDVTRMNGYLDEGVYVVKNNNSAVKVIVK